MAGPFTLGAGFRLDSPLSATSAIFSTLKQLPPAFVFN